MTKAPNIPKRRTMYDRGPAGRARQVLADEVDKWKAAGWFLSPEEEAPAEPELSVVSDTVKVEATAADATKATRSERKA